MKNNKPMAFFQTMSRSFLTAIALLSFTSLLLGIASVFLWHDSLRAMLPILNHPVLQYLAKLMDVSASVVMNNLALIFAIPLAFSLAKEEKAFAAFAAFVGYMAFLMSMGLLLSLAPHLEASFPKNAISTVMGIRTLNTGVLGGIIVGLLTGIIHNRTYQTRLPMAIAFFGGVRAVAIANLFVFMLIGQVFPFLWVYISKAIFFVAGSVANAGIFGPFLYGFGERILIPTGLHQIWNTIIRDTVVSGSAVFADGTMVEGGRGIYNAFLKYNTLPEGTQMTEVVRFLRGGQIPITMFVLPAIAYAMYQCADEDKKPQIKPLIVTGIFTSILAGVTEPLEFAFLFVSPMLYLIYSVMNGLSWMLCYVLGSQLGGTEANIIGLAIFGWLQPQSLWYINCAIGAVFAVGSYFLFRWWIIKFDVKTPGRGGDYDESLAASVIHGSEKMNFSTEDPAMLKAQIIVQGLGGADNISSVEACYSRLRVMVKDSSKINESEIKKTGCSGVVAPSPEDIQIIYGPTVNIILNAVRKVLNRK